MIVRTRSAKPKPQQLRILLQDAKPLLTFAVIAAATAFFILHPLGSMKTFAFLRIPAPPAQTMSAPPGVICCSYPGQIPNYRQRLVDAFGGSVALSPDDGLPDRVTITLASPLSPGAAHLRAITAWRELMAMRRNYLQLKEAGVCVVTVCDPSGTPLVTIDRNPDEAPASFR